MQNQQRKNFFADRLLEGQARNSSTSVSSFSPVLTLLSSSDSMHVSYFNGFSKHLVCIWSTILACVSSHLWFRNSHISRECRVQCYKFLGSRHLLTSLKCWAYHKILSRVCINLVMLGGAASSQECNLGLGGLWYGLKSLLYLRRSKDVCVGEELDGIIK